MIKDKWHGINNHVPNIHNNLHVDQNVCINIKIIMLHIVNLKTIVIVYGILRHQVNMNNLQIHLIQILILLINQILNLVESFLQMAHWIHGVMLDFIIIKMNQILLVK